MNSQANSASSGSGRSLLIPRSRQRGFIICFTVLTILGFATGWVVSQVVSHSVRQVLFDRFVKQFLLNNFPLKLLFQLPLDVLYGDRYIGSVFLLGEFLERTIFGVILGTTQWFALRRYLSFSRLWIVAVTSGYTISSNLLVFAAIATVFPQSPEKLFGLIKSSLPASLNYTPGGLIALIFLALLGSSVATNISIGLAQWLVLRRSLYSIWWWIFVPVTVALIINILWLPIFVGIRLLPSLNSLLNLLHFIASATIWGIIQGVSFCACRQKTNSSTVQP